MPGAVGSRLAWHPEADDSRITIRARVGHREAKGRGDLHLRRLGRRKIAAVGSASLAVTEVVMKIASSFHSSQ
jgi:hypothetical protein